MLRYNPYKKKEEDAASGVLSIHFHNMNVGFPIMAFFIFCISIVAIGIGSVAAFENVPKSSIPDNAVTANGTVEITSNFITRSIVPRIDNRYDLGDESTPFAELYITYINDYPFADIIRQSTTSVVDNMIMVTSANSIGDSGVSKNDLLVGPLLSRSGGTLNGNLDFDNHNILNMELLNDKLASQIVANTSGTFDSDEVTVITNTGNIMNEAILLSSLVQCRTSTTTGNVAIWNTSREIKDSGINGSRLVNGPGATAGNQVVVYSSDNSITTSSKAYTDIPLRSNFTLLNDTLVNGSLRFTTRNTSQPYRCNVFAQDDVVVATNSDKVDFSNLTFQIVGPFSSVNKDRIYYTTSTSQWFSVLITFSVHANLSQSVGFCIASTPSEITNGPFTTYQVLTSTSPTIFVSLVRNVHLINNSFVALALTPRAVTLTISGLSISVTPCV